MMLLLFMLLPSALAIDSTSSIPDDSNECGVGYHLEMGYFDYQCVKNKCRCTDGMGAVATQCPVHDAEKCTACGTGYYLNGTTCAQNICTCENGSPAKGRWCNTHGDPKCTACDEGTGTFLDGDKCVAWRDCGAGQVIRKEGTTTLDRWCQTRYCRCDNGVGAYATACPAPISTEEGRFGEKIHTFAEKCASCNDGYKPEGDYCVPKYTCTCDNGSAATGGDCPSNGAKCASCLTGYGLTSDSKCEEFDCECVNGSPKTPCTKHGTDCQSCNSGYTEYTKDDGSTGCRRDTYCNVEECLWGSGNDNVEVNISTLIKSKNCGDDLCEFCTLQDLKDYYKRIRCIQ